MPLVIQLGGNRTASHLLLVGLGPNMTVCMVQGVTGLVLPARERSQVFAWLSTHSRDVWAFCCPTTGLRQDSKMRVDNADVTAIE